VVWHQKGQDPYTQQARGGESSLRHGIGGTLATPFGPSFAVTQHDDSPGPSGLHLADSLSTRDVPCPGEGPHSPFSVPPSQYGIAFVTQNLSVLV
jgi:hypothetical protein